MKITPTPLQDVFVFEPQVFGDQRGYFFESFNPDKVRSVLGETIFVQDNESLSSKGVLRGLHFQRPPFTQTKLIRCVQGEILDVVVDLRKASPGYGKYFSIRLSGENKKQIFVPKGFAHGFVVLSEKAIITYKVDHGYAPNHDSGIAWNDPELGIDWGVAADAVIISEKDKQLQPLSKIENPF